MLSFRTLSVTVAAAAAALTTMTACGGSAPSAAPGTTVTDTTATTSSAGSASPTAAAAGTAPAAQAPAGRQAPVAQTATDVVPGTITYFTYDRGDSIRVHRYVAGSGRSIDFGKVGAGDVAGRPSRDGTRFALIDSTNGDLIVVEPGGARRTLARNVSWGAGMAPSWSMDGETIVVGNTRYDVARGTAEPAGLADGNAGYLVFSDNGATRAYARTEHDIEISGADGSGARTVSIAHLPQCDQFPTCPFAVQAVSNDGRYVALGHGNSDPGHTYTTAVVLDTRSGATVALDTDDLLHVWFTATGAVVHTGNAVHVHDSGWKRVATVLAPQVRTDTEMAAYHS